MDNTQRYRNSLDALIDMGTELARHVHAHAMAKEPDAKLLRQFDHAARCVRLCIMLAQRLDQAPRVPARRTVLRAVEDVIQRETDGPEAESLHAEARERLDRPDFEDDLATRPIDEIITEICRDLGLAHIQGAHHPWKRRTPADIAQLHAVGQSKPAFHPRR